ncbi:hypothetical protein BDR05DRAFT_881316, partial [Suillus weaverae]
QILCVTCNNAFNNTVMLDDLEANLPDFSGTAAHTCCFLHTVNLVAKLLLREFDVLKKDKEAL